MKRRGFLGFMGGAVAAGAGMGKQASDQNGLAASSEWENGAMIGAEGKSRTPMSIDGVVFFLDADGFRQVNLARQFDLVDSQ